MPSANSKVGCCDPPIKYLFAPSTDETVTVIALLIALTTPTAPVPLTDSSLIICSVSTLIVPNAPVPAIPSTSLPKLKLDRGNNATLPDALTPMPFVICQLYLQIYLE